MGCSWEWLSHFSLVGKKESKEELHFVTYERSMKSTFHIHMYMYIQSVLAPSNAHLRTYHLWLLSCYKGRVNSWDRDPVTHRAQDVYSLPSSKKKFADSRLWAFLYSLSAEAHLRPVELYLFLRMHLPPILIVLFCLHNPSGCHCLNGDCPKLSLTLRSNKNLQTVPFPWLNHLVPSVLRDLWLPTLIQQ